MSGGWSRYTRGAFERAGNGLLVQHHRRRSDAHGAHAVDEFHWRAKRGAMVMMRPLLALGIAAIPLLLVWSVAEMTGRTSKTSIVEAVICTALLLSFAAYRKSACKQEE